MLCWQTDNNFQCSAVVIMMMNVSSRVRLTSRGVSPLFLLLRTQNVIVVGFCIVLFGVFGVCGYQEQKFAMEPQDQVIILIILYLIYI